MLQAHGPSPGGAQRERIRARLLDVRGARARPGLDDKRLTSWNALMICALADAGATLDGDGGAAPEPAGGAALDEDTGATPERDGGAALEEGGEPRYLDAARACADFVLSDMRDCDGQLLRTYNDGRAQIGAYLEDHAYLLEALIVLFETTCEERWFTEAIALADTLIARFADPAAGRVLLDRVQQRQQRRRRQQQQRRGGSGGSSSSGSEELIARRKDLEDTPIPAGQSSAAMGLLRLSQLTGNVEYERHAVSVLRLLADDRAPSPDRVRSCAAGAALAFRPSAPDRVRGTHA